MEFFFRSPPSPYPAPDRKCVRALTRPQLVPHSFPAVSLVLLSGVLEYVDNSEHSLHLECLPNRRSRGSGAGSGDDDESDDDDHQWT